MSLSVPQPPAHSPLVLLVEDHADSRELYTLDLKQSGFRVDEADGVAQAIRQVAKTTPDVVVTDLGLPDGDGIAFCRTLKQATPTGDVPIIALTGHGDAETARAARDAGCAAVLVKPCVPDHLRHEITRVLAAAQDARRKAQAVLERAHALSRKSAALKVRSEVFQERLARQLLGIALTDQGLLESVSARVRAEFQEMPGLRLSGAQAARFLGLDKATADSVLGGLVEDGFLRKTASGLYFIAAA